MIDKINKITIYVENQEEAKDFWLNKMGFVLRAENVMMGGTKWIEVSPKDDEKTMFVLYDKNLMAQQNTSINVGHPSIILHSNDIEKSHEDMKKAGIKVEDIMNLPYGNMYKFLDNEGNSYLVYSE